MEAKKAEVVLDRTGVIQLLGGVASLLVLGFTAGAVVGFWVHGGGELPAGVTAAPPSVVPATTAPQTCVPAEADAPLRMAELPPPAETAEPGSATGAGDVFGVDAVDPGIDEAGDGAGDPAFDFETPYVPVRPRYAVQVGVFGVDTNADRMVDQLRRRGYDPLVTAVRNRSGQWMKRVSLSVYDSEDLARMAAETFTHREGLPAVVVAHREEQE